LSDLKVMHFILNGTLSSCPELICQTKCFAKPYSCPCSYKTIRFALFRRCTEPLSLSLTWMAESIACFIPKSLCCLL
jgi:hypothetical protein